MNVELPLLVRVALGITPMTTFVEIVSEPAAALVNVMVLPRLSLTRPAISHAEEVWVAPRRSNVTFRLLKSAEFVVLVTEPILSWPVNEVLLR